MAATRPTHQSGLLAYTDDHKRPVKFNPGIVGAGDDNEQFWSLTCDNITLKQTNLTLQSQAGNDSNVKLEIKDAPVGGSATGYTLFVNHKGAKQYGYKDENGSSADDFSYTMKHEAGGAGFDHLFQGGVKVQGAARWEGDMDIWGGQSTPSRKALLEADTGDLWLAGHLEVDSFAHLGAELTGVSGTYKRPFQVAADGTLAIYKAADGAMSEMLSVNSSNGDVSAKGILSIGALVGSSNPVSPFSVSTAGRISIKKGDDKDEKFSVDDDGNIATKGYIDMDGHAKFSVAEIDQNTSSLTIDPKAVGANTGLVIIAGNLQVDGGVTTINSTELTVDDKQITIASGASDAAAANGAGILVDGASASLSYTASSDDWYFNKPVRAPKASFTAEADNVQVLTVKANSAQQSADLLSVVDSADANALKVTAAKEVVAASLTVSDLVAGRLPIVSTAGSIIDDGALTFTAAASADPAKLNMTGEIIATTLLRSNSDIKIIDGTDLNWHADSAGVVLQRGALRLGADSGVSGERKFNITDAGALKGYGDMELGVASGSAYVSKFRVAADTGAFSVGEASGKVFDVSSSGGISAGSIVRSASALVISDGGAMTARGDLILQADSGSAFTQKFKVTVSTGQVEAAGPVIGSSSADFTGGIVGRADLKLGSAISSTRAFVVDQNGNVAINELENGQAQRRVAINADGTASFADTVTADGLITANDGLTIADAKSLTMNDANLGSRQNAAQISVTGILTSADKAAFAMTGGQDESSVSGYDNHLVTAGLLAGVLDRADSLFEIYGVEARDLSNAAPKDHGIMQWDVSSTEYKHVNELTLANDTDSGRSGSAAHIQGEGSLLIKAGATPDQSRGYGLKLLSQDGDIQIDSGSTQEVKLTGSAIHLDSGMLQKKDWNAFELGESVAQFEFVGASFDSSSSAVKYMKAGVTPTGYAPRNLVMVAKAMSASDGYPEIVMPGQLLRVPVANFEDSGTDGDALPQRSEQYGHWGDQSNMPASSRQLHMGLMVRLGSSGGKMKIKATAEGDQVIRVGRVAKLEYPSGSEATDAPTHVWIEYMGEDEPYTESLA